MIEPMADDPGLDTNYAVDALDQALDAATGLSSRQRAALSGAA